MAGVHVPSVSETLLCSSFIISPGRPATALLSSSCTHSLSHTLTQIRPRSFLIDTFGPSILCSPTGLLDVAGGQGDLSFELVNLNSVRSTVLDPRPLNLSKSLRKLNVRRRRRRRGMEICLCVCVLGGGYAVRETA